MIYVTYTHQFPYKDDGRGYFPILQLRISSVRDALRSVDIDAYLDSGATRSLFYGWIAAELGYELLAGERLPYVSTTKQELEGRIHPVRIAYADVDPFVLEVGFATGEISRNILGRDFFALAQIGFHERAIEYYLSPVR